MGRRHRRDANMAQRVGDVDVESQLGGRVQGLEIRSKSSGGELMHLKALASIIASCAPAPPTFAGQARLVRTTISWH
jgi:hypothetical protein